MPPRGVAVKDIRLQSLVIINDPEAPSGHSFLAEVTYQCPNRTIVSKELFPVDEE